MDNGSLWTFNEEQRAGIKWIYMAIMGFMLMPTSKWDLPHLNMFAITPLVPGFSPFSEL
jgi:hypothetical protein